MSPEGVKSSGPKGPPEPEKDKNVADAKKFRDLMKVDKTDEEQKQKKRQRGETEAQKRAEREAQRAAPQPVEEKTPTLSFTPPQEKAKETPPPKAEIPRGPAAEPLAPPAMPETGAHEEMPKEPERVMPKAEEKAPPEKVQQEKAAEKAHIKKKEAIAKEGAIARKEEKETFFKEMGKDKKEKAQEPEEVQQAAIVPQREIVSETKKAEKKEEKVEAAASAAPAAPSLDTGAAAGPLGTQPTTPPPSYAHLHPLVFELFEKMVGVMTVMTNAGITEYTLTLNAPEYSGSIFFGSQISIKEYSTAPKAFNVTVISNPQGVSLMQANSADLMAAFQAGNYNFRVNRFEAVLPTEKPLVRRKESTGEEKGRESA